jgi:hypothetical protein
VSGWIHALVGEGQVDGWVGGYVVGWVDGYKTRQAGQTTNGTT